MNVQTRLFYDDDVARARDVTSSEAMKWYTTDTQQNRALEYGHSRDIHLSTNLSRGTITRNTDKDCVNTELYGTAPYLFSRSGNNRRIDDESVLFHKQMDGVNSCDRKPMYSETYYGPDVPTVVETQRGGMSTRNERIVYGRQKNNLF